MNRLLDRFEKFSLAKIWRQNMAHNSDLFCSNLFGLANFFAVPELYMYLVSNGCSINFKSLYTSGLYGP